MKHEIKKLKEEKKCYEKLYDEQTKLGYSEEDYFTHFCAVKIEEINKIIGDYNEII